MSDGEYNALDQFFYTESSLYYSINNKPDHSSEYQPDEFQDKLSEQKSEEYSYPSRWNLKQKQSVLN